MYNVVFITPNKELDFLKLTDGQLNLLEYLKDEGYLNPNAGFVRFPDNKDIKFSMV